MANLHPESVKNLYPESVKEYLNDDSKISENRIFYLPLDKSVFMLTQLWVRTLGLQHDESDIWNSDIRRRVKRCINDIIIENEKSLLKHPTSIKLNILKTLKSFNNLDDDISGIEKNHLLNRNYFKECKNSFGAYISRSGENIQIRSEIKKYFHEIHKSGKRRNESISKLLSILCESESPYDVFSDSKFLKSMGADIWVGIYSRCVLIDYIISENYETSTVVNLSKQDFCDYLLERYDFNDINRILESLKFNPPFKGVKTNTLDKEITSYPVFLMPDGTFITSIILIMDSIVPFVSLSLSEAWWEDNITVPFEDKVISNVRGHGRFAGRVNDSCFWDVNHNLNKNKDSITSIRSSFSHNRKDFPGEIDCLILSDEKNKDLILVECKSKHQGGDIHKEMFQSEDKSGWHLKLDKRKDWLERQGYNVISSIIVIEGIDIGISPNSFNLNGDFFQHLVMDYETFEEFIRYLLSDDLLSIEKIATHGLVGY